MIKKCAICGKEFQTIPCGGSRKYCFDCVPAGLDEGQRTICKRQAAKHEAVRRLGGRCEKCGETREHILAFHHINPSEKDDTPSRLLADSKITEFFKEIDKCILLCNNCHGDFHFLHDNLGISLEDYLNKKIERATTYDNNLEQLKEKEKNTLTTLQQVQAQQDLLLAQKVKKQSQKHIYQGGVIAYTDSWLKEFASVKECVAYFASNIFTDVTPDNISDGIRRVLNEKRKTYHGYYFVKNN